MMTPHSLAFSGTTQDTQTSKTSHTCDAVVEAAGDPAGIVEDMMDAK